jgi:MFS family permease
MGERSFRFLFLARTVSLFGSAIAVGVLPFAVLDMRGGSATVLGLVLGARSLAQVALLLFGGVLADRLPRFRLMVGSDLCAFGAQAIAAALFITRAATPVEIITLSAVNGAAAALFLPASKGVVPQVVAGERLQAANVLLRLSRNSTSIVGTALGGVLVMTIGSGWALAVDASTFAISAALLAGVRLAHSDRAAGSSVLTDLREGWREFSSRSWVWLVVLQFTFVNGCFAAINVLGPLTAKQHMGGAPAWTTILAAQSAGLVGGSLVAARLRPRFPVRTAVTATFGFLPPFFLFAVGAPMWLVAASMLVNGVCVDIFEVLWDTALQLHIPNEALSRISSYDALGSFVLGPWCLILVGSLSALIGVQQTFLAAGALLTVMNLATLASRSVRHLSSRRPGMTAPTLEL